MSLKTASWCQTLHILHHSAKRGSEWDFKPQQEDAEKIGSASQQTCNAAQDELEFALAQQGGQCSL